MTFLSLHKLVTYLLAGLGLYALTLGFEIGPWRSALFAIGYAASAFAEGPAVHARSWSVGWTVAVVAAFAVQLARAALGAPVLELGVEYAAFLQISRLFNRRGGRDHQQIAVLAFLHLVAATVLTTDVRFAFTFLGFVVAAPWMLALSHLRREIEDHYPKPDADPQGDAPPTDVARVLASRRLVGVPFLAGTASLAIPLVASTAVLFLAFPRVGLGLFTFGQTQGQLVAGFGVDVELGDFGVVRDDPTVVARVTPRGTVRPPHLRPPFRLRGTSFDRYAAGRWVRSSTGDERLPPVEDGELWLLRDLDPEAPSRGLPGHRIPTVPVDILLDHLDEPVVFVPEHTVRLAVRPRHEGGTPRSRPLERRTGFDLRYQGADAVGLSYRAHVALDPLPVGGELTLDPVERARHLAVPVAPEARPAQLAALARAAVGDASTPEAKVGRLLDLLQRSGRYRYTRALARPPDGVDPLAHFLLESHAGHCEYFSTALAVLLRYVDVPTRNVTGFLGGTFNPFGEYWAIRQGDAHSWVEVWLDGRGWVTVDPTPPGRDVAPGDGLLDRFRAFGDALRTRWLDWVVTYDFDTQQRGLEALVGWLGQSRGGGMRDLGGARGTSTVLPASRPAPVLVAALAAAAVVALALAWRVRRRRAAGGLDEALRPAVRLFQALDALLARHGRARPAACTPGAWAQELRREGFPGADSVCRITDAYLAARFAGRFPTSEGLTALEGELRALRAILASSHGPRPR